VPRLSKEMKNYLAKALSGFGNANGGIVVYGVSTIKHEHSGTDVLKQVEYVGACSDFANSIRAVIPRLTTPPIMNSEVKTIKDNETETKGIVIVYCPKTIGNPIQSTCDDHFYIRMGDEFKYLPYDILKGLFFSISSPDLFMVLTADMVKQEEDMSWNIPLKIGNRSNICAKDTALIMSVLNDNDLLEIHVLKMRDISDINKGDRTFQFRADVSIYKHLDMVISPLRIKEKSGKNEIVLSFLLLADNMIARRQTIIIKIDDKMNIKIDDNISYEQ
jgi:schlafen family protein